MGLVQSIYQYPYWTTYEESDENASEIKKEKKGKGLKIQMPKEDAQRRPSDFLTVRDEDGDEGPNIQTPIRGFPSFSRINSITDEKVYLNNARLSTAGLGHIINEVDGVRDEIEEYCLPLVVLHFCGQTSSLNDKRADQAQEGEKLLTLKNYLRMLDKFIRQHKVVTQLTGEEQEYCAIIRLIATQRYQKNIETVEDCYQRLMDESKTFIQIYHKRGELSQPLETKTYWGSRQQLLSGKVIADWVDRENGSLDPIFGVLLHPTSGRVGPGDSYWIHNFLFDDRGHMAYHAAVHDAFGYLKQCHDIGPGYNYLNQSSYFHPNNTDSPLAGQLPGLAFWKKVIHEIQLKQRVLEHWRC